MRFRLMASQTLAPVIVSVLGLLTFTSGVVAASASAASAAPASQSPGWIQLAHLSPNTPAVDVYLYSFGNSHAMIVLHHVSYGTVSPFEKVTPGEYTVAMRAAGAPASSNPVLSTSVTIAAGKAYTVAGMGPAKGLRLQILADRLTTPRGKALVRVIQASLRHPKVTIMADGRTLANGLPFAQVTSYVTTPPGTWHVHVAGMGAMGARDVTLAAGTIYTLVVLDSSQGGLEIDPLEDAAGSTVMPQGGAATGLGGTAPSPAPSPILWLSVLAGGALVASVAAARMRRVRSAARHAR
jgi:Domain of unknown function (DUF4397)